MIKVGKILDKAAEADSRFAHVMAVTLDSKTDYKTGVIRCITSRSGEVTVKGNTDRSQLNKMNVTESGRFEIGEKLEIKNEAVIVNQLMKEGDDFIGLEDPDIWRDEKGLIHLYFTIPITKKSLGKTITHLGHAVGESLENMEMTWPVLVASEGNRRAKEVSIMPLNRRGYRYNLVESRDNRDSVSYSTVSVAKALDMEKDWEWGEVLVHPADTGLDWISGHASPGPVLPRSFVDVGDDKLVVILNGRGKDRKEGDKIYYGMFSVGLMVYNYEAGRVEWVSPEPIISDPEAKTITFASQFVEKTGILYAHVDDSFVRGYKLIVY